jgi:predicted nucleic acid-binding protein
MELYSGAVARPSEGVRSKALLETFTVLPIDSGIAEQAIAIRRNSLLNPPKVKLPDAIIGATAVQWRIPLITRNPEDFTSLADLVPVHVPYDYDARAGVATNVRPPYRSTSSPSLTILK